VLLDGAETELQDFQQIAAVLADDYVKEFSLLTFTIATASRFESAGALRNFLETHWPAAAERMTACWIDPGRPIASQLRDLAAAQPLAAWAGDAESPLRRILDERRIDTWYQPIFAGKGLHLWGYECLARATDDDGGLISPAELLRWAQHENLLFMFDRVCRERHIENAARVPNAERLNFLINFLPTVIYEPGVCLSTTFAAARKSGLPSKQIIFEVVETEKIDDRDFLRKILDEYRAAGFRVALDDLGSGHAGLTLLGDLSPDLIKIDRELVAKSTESTIHRSICRSIVEIARESDKLVLAEGVETHEEYALFREFKVDLFQGFLFGHPSSVPAREADIASMTAVHKLAQ